MTKRVSSFNSLNTRAVLVLLVGILCGALIFFAMRSLGNYFIESYYMSPEAISSRRLDIYNDLKAYVLKNQISSNDSLKIGEWSKNKTYVNIVIRGEHVKVEAGKWGAAASELPATSNQSYQPLTGEGIYYLRFSDGIYQVSISENSQSREYTLCTIISVMMACLSVILIMILYIHQITARVIGLSKSAQEIGFGNLNKEIFVKGSDELSLLGREMDDMRLAVIRRIDSEHKAWQANSSLLTAISHDLRTPMTAMIGYLELLKNGEYSNDEQRSRFIDNAHSKAMELKDLTDELFKYFLVFGNPDIPLQIETYDAGILLDQLLGESIIGLRDSGYSVRYIKFSGEYSINVDVLNLKRVFDNLFSNIKKYADKSRPVIIISEVNDSKYLSICFSNVKSSNVGKVESSRIGLQTCAKIVDQLGGRFKTGGDEDHFVAEVSLPAIPREQSKE